MNVVPQRKRTLPRFDSVRTTSPPHRSCPSGAKLRETGHIRLPEYNGEEPKELGVQPPLSLQPSR